MMGFERGLMYLINSYRTKQASADYARQIVSQNIVLAYNNQTYPMKLSDLGASFSSTSGITYDTNKLNTALGKIGQNIYIAPVNASLAYADGQFTPTQPQNGQGFDEDTLKQSINSLVSSHSQNQINLATTVLTPKIGVDNLSAAQTAANNYLLAAPINLTYTDSDNQIKNFRANKDQIASWITFEAKNDQLAAQISDSKLNDFIDTIASQIDIPAQDQEIAKDTGKVLVEGQDGLALDRVKLSTEIKAALAAASASATVAIQTAVVPHSSRQISNTFTPGNYSGRYIEVSLAKQTMYAYDNNKLVLQTLISSGVATHPTITGIFYVYGKSRVTEMKGEGYDLPGVQWVSWWSGDYSIHGTYWHHNFGHPMSHGCINATNADAEWIYNWDSIGTPVWVHQ